MSLVYGLDYFKNHPRRLIKTIYKKTQQHHLRVAGIQGFGIDTEKMREVAEQLRKGIVCP